jgi:hypothetical protein
MVSISITKLDFGFEAIIQEKGKHPSTLLGVSYFHLAKSITAAYGINIISEIHLN